MSQNKDSISKCVSILNRIGNTYYDQRLENDPIGSGQMFFLLRISEHEGISILELAADAYYDKGTTARAVQRLEELSYVKRQVNETDKRVQRLYLTKQGKAMIPKIKEIINTWEKELYDDLSQEEIIQCKALLVTITNHACKVMKERKKEIYERNHHK